MTESIHRAYVLRMTLGGKNRIDEALDENQIMIGWSIIPNLLDAGLSRNDIRALIKKNLYPNDKDYSKAGADAGEVTRFREMNNGDLVVIPQPKQFYVAQISGDAFYLRDRVPEDTSYRRPVKWLNSKQPIPRIHARAFLQSRMKYQRTLVEATDLIEQIQETLASAKSGLIPSFGRSLRGNLIKRTQEEICSGHMNDRSFETLIASVLKSLGGEDVHIVGRNVDKGIDITAVFPVANAFKLRVGVQAKHYRPESGPVPESRLQELIRGMKAEEVDLGIFITSGIFSEDFLKRVDEEKRLSGLKIETIDGEQLASIIVENGIRKIG